MMIEPLECRKQFASEFPFDKRIDVADQIASGLVFTTDDNGSVRSIPLFLPGS